MLLRCICIFRTKGLIARLDSVGWLLERRGIVAVFIVKQFVDVFKDHIFMGSSLLFLLKRHKSASCRGSLLGLAFFCLSLLLVELLGDFFISLLRSLDRQHKLAELFDLVVAFSDNQMNKL